MHGNRRLSTMSLAAAAVGILLSACRPAAPGPRSELAGEWRGKALTRSTNHKESIVEDYQLTIRPDGRLSAGLIPFERIERAGQRLSVGRATVRVLRADYQPGSTEVAVEVVGLTGQGDSRTGAAASARLLPDGQLDLWLYSYELIPGRVRESQSVLLRAVLHRVSTSQPERAQP